MRPRLRRLLLPAAVAAALAAPGTARAAEWCGTLATQDRPALATGPHVRVVYAVAADGIDRGAEIAPLLWADVQEIDAWWRANDSSRTVNFDLAQFACGAQVDLTLLQLPFPAAELQSSGLRFNRIRDALFGDPRTDARHSKYLVYYDGPVAERNLCGEGGGSPAGTGLAILYIEACAGATRAAVAAHELLHAFGALRGVVPPNACPNDAAHVCDSTDDILYPFAQPLPLSSFVLDARRDDYYGHPHPWFDVRASAWLRHLDAQAPLRVTLRGRGAVRSDIPGLVCAAATCRTEWNPGSEVVLLADAAPGQRFVEWRGACGGSTRRCDVLLERTAAVTAVFAPARFRLNVQIAGRGRVTAPGVSCAATCTRQLVSHRPVTLRAAAAAGWRLRGWVGACRGAKLTCTVPLNRATSVRATFVRRR